MALNQRNRIVIRGVVAALWLIGFLVATSTGTVQLIYLLPILALFSFFLVDYFSGFIIAILLTVVVKTLYLDQVPATVRALLIDAIWIAAIFAAGIKLIKPFTTTIVDKRGAAQPISDERITIQTGELPLKFWHDLQTPVSMILGLCQAILRADPDHGQVIPPLHRDNVHAIYRNAQQMEKMIADFPNRLKPVQIPDAEALDPVALIQDTATLIQDLMLANGLTLEIKIGDTLPTLRLDRITIRQVLLNVLRTIARANGLSGDASLVTVRAQVQPPALHIIVTALTTNIGKAMADANWSLNEQLLEKIGGRFWLETNVDPGGYRNMVLAFPFPAALPTVRPVLPGITTAVGHPNVLVISEESKVIDLFKKQLSQYTVIAIKDINALYLSAAPVQAVAVILTREQDNARMQMISAVVGNHTPIIACPIATAQERLQRLNAVYLSKPVDAESLLGMLAIAASPIASVLIVDDNTDSADMLARMLVTMSPTVVTLRASLAQEALNLLETHPIDAIILDVFLPDMDGIALVQQIRSRKQFARVPIVLVSAQPNIDSMLPVIESDTISLFQPDGYPANKFASYIEALINVIVSS